MLRPVLALLTAAFLWSTSFPLIKWGLSSIPPFTFAFWRFVLATLFFLMFPGRAWGQTLRRVIRHKGLWVLAALNALGYVFQFAGQQYTDASRTALLINMYVLWVPLLTILVDRIFPRPVVWVALVLALVGLGMVTTGGQGLEVLLELRGLGDGLALLASLSWAVYILLAKRILVQIEPRVLSFAVVAGSVPFLLPLYLTEGALPDGFTAWAMVVYLALFCTVLPYVLYAWGLKRTSATFSSLVLLFEVVMAAVLSSLFLGERFTSFEMVGGGMILAAIALGGIGESQGRG